MHYSYEQQFTENERAAITEDVRGKFVGDCLKEWSLMEKSDPIKLDIYEQAEQNFIDYMRVHNPIYYTRLDTKIVANREERHKQMEEDCKDPVEGTDQGLKGSQMLRNRIQMLRAEILADLKVELDFIGDTFD